MSSKNFLCCVVNPLVFLLSLSLGSGQARCLSLLVILDIVLSDRGRFSDQGIKLFCSQARHSLMGISPTHLSSAYPLPTASQRGWANKNPRSDNLSVQNAGIWGPTDTLTQTNDKYLPGSLRFSPPPLSTHKHTLTWCFLYTLRQLVSLF